MPTFSVDDLLPSMPVPCLAKTCDNYLESVRPFVTDEELKTTAKVVENFKNGVGKDLQVLLVEKAKHERNWLEKYWLDYAYLEWRDPIAPCVNTSGMLGGSSEKEFQYVPSGYKLDVRLSYVALQCFYYAEFHALLRSEQFPIQRSRNSFFSMNQWRGLFNTCRIPQLNKDRLDIHFKTLRESSECPTHLTVMYKYRFYRLETYHQGKQLNITEFYRQLEKIVAIGDSKAFGVGIGALTADNRDSWAKNRQHLIDLNPENTNSFKQIEQSTYVIVLDEATALNNSELAKLGLCGDPKNRFFDKSVVSICTKNGRFTSNVDHTPFDGMVSGSLTLYATQGKKRDKFDISMTNSFPSRSKLPEPQELHFVYDHRIEMEIQKAANIFKRNADEILTKECKITNCNKDLIKTFRTNPDTFAQMCMQLAYFQLHRKPAPTYESATTRSYYHGRTETVRSCSSQALEWCQQMCNEDVRTRLADSQLLELFKRACKKHDQLMGQARQNALCDRHLLGLKLLARDLDMKLPDIYKDAAWKKSGGDGNFVISSSCLGFTNCVGTCGPMCLDGYSMIYAFPDDGITFELARFASSKDTCLDKISASLQSAIDRTKALFKVASKI